MSQTFMRRRGVFGAFFATAVLAASFLIVGGAGMAQAQSTTASCDIKQFKNPDGSIDTVGYLACVQQANGTAPKPAADCPTADLQLMATADPNTVSPGQSTTFKGVGFAPNSTVQLSICSTPVGVGTVQADGTGAISVSVSVPAGTVLGSHTLAAVGQRSNGLQQVAYAAITVVSANGGGTPTTGQLPTTGSDVGRFVAIGSALVLLGGAAVFGSIRSRRPALVETD